MNKKLAVEKGEILTVKPYSPFSKLIFNVEEIIIQCGKLELKLPRFWDLKHIDTIIFDFGKDGKHTYKKQPLGYHDVEEFYKE